MKDFFQACNTINGRWNRKKFLLYPLGMSLLIVFPLVILFAAGSSISQGIGTILLIPLVLGYLYAMYVSIAAYIKRFHDLGKSGWYTLLVFVPIVNIFALVWLIFFKGTSGTNIYGHDPLGNNPNTLGSDVQSASQNITSSNIDL